MDLQRRVHKASFAPMPSDTAFTTLLSSASPGDTAPRANRPAVALHGPPPLPPSSPSPPTFSLLPHPPLPGARPPTLLLPRPPTSHPPAFAPSLALHALSTARGARFVACFGYGSVSATGARGCATYERWLPKGRSVWVRGLMVGVRRCEGMFACECKRACVCVCACIVLCTHNATSKCTQHPHSQRHRAMLDP